MPRLGEARWLRARAEPRQVSICRCCGLPLEEPLADLGMAPLACAPVAPDAALAFHPLSLLVCSDCRLVQQPGSAPEGAVLHAAPWQAEAFAAATIATLGLDGWTPAAEIGAGAMLPAFARRGVPTMRQAAPGFGIGQARRLRADGLEPVLILVPDALGEVASLHDLVAGVREWLAPGGVAMFDVPSLQTLMAQRRIDRIQHGRLCWFTLATAEMVLAQHGLVIFDAARTGRDGGGLRLLARHAEDRGKPLTPAIEALRREEAAAGLGAAAAYRAFAEQLVEAKCALLDFLVGVQRAGRRVAAIGLPHGAATMLTWCGVGPELVGFTADDDPRHAGMLLPGTRIPIRASSALSAARPDFVLVLSAASRAELAAGLPDIRAWGGRYVVPLPTIDIF